MKKRIISFLFAAAVIFCLPLSIVSNAVYNSELELKSPRYYVVNLDTDTVIFDKASTERCAPASLTKIATAIVTLEHCPDLEEKVTLSQSAIDALAGTGSSLAGIRVGEALTVKNMLACLLIPSANEAALALAEYVGGGSVQAFVDMMNETAANLGCENTHFVNVHGLDEDGHYSCARDVAALVRRALEFPVFEELVAMREYELPATNMQDARTIENTNKMMLEGIREYYLDGITGVKTGSTTNAGRCVAATATRDGYTYLAVVMGSPFYDYDEDGADENFAFMEAKDMINWAFTNIRLKTVAEPSQIAGVMDVKYARKVDHLRLVPAKSYSALVPVSVEPGSVLIEPVEDASTPELLRAPVKKGEYICKGKVIYAGEEILTVDLVAAQTVRFSLIAFIITGLKAIVGSVIFKVLLCAFLIFVAVFIFLTIQKNTRRNRNRIKRVK